MKLYYEDGAVKLYHGDCREVLPGLEAFDLMLTDPPYGVGVETDNAGKKRGFRPHDQCGPARDHEPVFGDDRPFDPTGLLFKARNFVLWGANNYARRLPDSPCWFVWDRKAGRGGGDVTDCELAWTLGLPFKTVRMFSHLWCGFLRDSEVGGQSLHPTQKPVALMAWCLSFFSKAETVIDPYCGTGPVLRAAKDAGIKATGIEISERYCEISAKRLAQETLFPLTERQSV